MDFNWNNPTFSPEGFSFQEIEEAFEDPFGLRLLPDDSFPATNRFFLLGKSTRGTRLFCVFRTDGKNYRVIAARKMLQEEALFYEQINAEALQ
ncbi:MAG: BrnT family toxin [Chthoniobacterales bacterium]|nr:BrnT family toxin [Chthoniobacterales bacterium]